MSTPEEPEKVTEHDLRCSTACTKAGLTALLFSALAISLLQPIDKKKSIDALEKYIALRSALETAIIELDTDPCWQALTKTKEGASLEESVVLKLLEYECVGDAPQPISPKITLQPALKSKKQTKKKNSTDKVPNEKDSDAKRLSPPTATKAYTIRELYGAKVIIGALAELSMRHLLDEARGASIKYDLYIYFWENQLHRLYSQNMETSKPVVEKEIVIEMVDKEINVKDSRIRYLTLADAKRLSNYTPLTFAEIERPISEQVQFSLSPSSPLLSLEAASVFVEIVIWISLVYFYLFQREAKKSLSFTAPATLFGVFSRTLMSKFMFYLLVLTPPVVAVFLAWQSSSYFILNITLAIMVIFVCIMIIRIGLRKI